MLDFGITLNKSLE